MQALIKRMMKELGEIGRDARGGYTRLAFDEAEHKTLDYLSHEMARLGLDVRRDTFGNLFARTSGGKSDAPLILVGSHADSVPCGGNYDGIAGTVCAIAVAKEAMRSGLSVLIEVVVFRAEESSRFGVSNLGSKAVVGALPREAAQYTDADGRTLGDVMAEQGLICMNTPYGGRIRAFIELHIEQGRVLETAGCPLGIVEAIAAPHRYRLTITGRADHSGATPMHLRSDALCGASEIVLLAETVGKRYAERSVVATVGHIEAVPNVMNVIAGSVVLSLDVRGAELEAIGQATGDILDGAERIARRRGLTLQIVLLAEEVPVRLDTALTDVLERAAEDIGAGTMRMVSGAGHDASYMARLAPSGMIFVPSKDGISHNPREYSSIADIVRGARVLYRAVERLAKTAT